MLCCNPLSMSAGAGPVVMLSECHPYVEHFQILIFSLLKRSLHLCTVEKSRIEQEQRSNWK